MSLVSLAGPLVCGDQRRRTHKVNSVQKKVRLDFLAFKKERVLVMRKDTCVGWLEVGAAGPVLKRELITVVGNARFHVMMPLVAITIDSLDLRCVCFYWDCLVPGYLPFPAG